MNSKHLLKANIFIFAFYAIFFYLGNNLDFLHIPRIIFGLAIILISGLNLAVLLKIILKKEFDFWEIVNFSLLGIIILYPLFLSLEFIFLKRVYQFLPMLNSIAITLILFLAIRINKLDWNVNFILIPNIKLREITKSPLFIALIIKTTVIAAIFSAYEFLPDKDPFKWLFRLSDLFEKNLLSPETYRPFFSSITYFFTRITGIEIFYFFKYIIPFFSLSIVFSIWLAARNIPNKNSQLFLLLSSLITSNVILYSQTAMPQVFVIFLAYYFISFLLYYHQNKDFFYYCAAGAVSFFAIFFHELSSIFFFVWLATTLFFFRKNLLLKKRDLFYIVIIILSNISILKFNFLFSWTKKIILLAKDMRINWLFPAYYTNVDGNAMGWESLFGVLKFYAYYVGPLVLFALTMIIYTLIKNKEFRIYLKEKLKNKELLILSICFFIFFSISEILPRAINFSFLPDRSWIFGGIFSTLFLFLLIDFQNDKKIFAWKFYIFFFSLLLIVIYGSVYINDQKKFLITKNEIASAKWIKNNLPPNRTIISSSQTSIIKYYSDSNLFPISPKFYYSENSPESLTKKSDIVNINKADLLEYLKGIEKNSESMKSSLENNSDNLTLDIKTFTDSASNNISASKLLLSKISAFKASSLANSENLYIYYSEKSKNNPYAERPYELVKDNIIDNFIFDQHPGKFKRIYENDGDGKVIIWKVL